ncbi:MULTISPECIES: VOC family protein [Actinomyces]|uniref:VOC family protein n=1 Tax=Actinomyces respiraculi TaxID=2744574 RepID=A0A7T0LJ03_9ACTO|nr:MULTISPECIES: VOC family protein [Actinomyces]QPL04470.1 VOC family protein [Actinomyces respiraculi]
MSSTQEVPRTGATGQYSTDGRPHGSTNLTPFLVLAGARGAIDFYRDVFGARVVDVTEMGGVVAHAELDFGHGKLQLGAPLPDYGLVPPPDGEEVCYSMGLYCPDVDAVVEAAVRAGALIRKPVATFVSGDRYASLRDPFGVRWSLMTRVEDISEAESARRVAAWAAEQSATQDCGSPA